MAQAAQDSLSDEALLPLKTYKYSSVDKSYISNYILRHYWNAAVELLPLSIAPNMVTLLGFFFIIINVAFVTIFVPDLVGPGPTWVYYSFALGVWMYSTFDNIDGKQARRTGTSSGLGELFDHGIDSLNCTLASVLHTAAMGLGSTQIGAFTALIPCLPMFFSTWETYHTHTLYLGYFNGPTEGLIIAIIIMILSGIYGPQIWRGQVADVFGHEELFGTHSFLDYWVAIVFGSFMIAHLPACVYNVVRARRRQGLPVLPVFMEWTSIVIFTVSVLGWLWSPYSTLLANNHLVLFCIVMSFVFGRMTTKIILAHLIRQPFPYWTSMLVPLIGGAILANLPYLGFPAVSAGFELWYLRFYLVYAFVIYMHWAFLVINRITTFLNINCLTIKKDKSGAKDHVYRNFGEPRNNSEKVGLKHH
ncbi:hypothetical protein EYB25_006620 [Talaromyces marneffei]|uniref:uncharacterized protein n=1 Tax=Talaromyces marneffei TaxID=37727 RepID=UPI0012A94646|nr:uncharacterized protein EYB26_007760 [Talaromyces marneffei]KAE8550394.1 hypothetical protein EYB25_006620 [Talaromyces marneffei]QGA20060.1 hypothetical protein EYB26_007760 [Talaromyces marneffei]